MRVLQIVILIFVVAYPDDVLPGRSDRHPKGAKKVDNGPCGRLFMRQISGKCYYIAGKKMNWFGAQNNCLRKGLNLADLSSEDELQAVIKFLRSKGNLDDFWFGGNDLQAEGHFTYISSGRPVKFVMSPGIEPTEHANLDDCLEIRLRENSTTITNDNCQESQYFICQENKAKCAQPVMDPTTSQRHSHEHLHHFHHDAAKGEVVEEGSKESLESDSRPADNTNSTEVSTSSESEEDTDGKKDEAEETGRENIGDAENVEDGKAEQKVEGEEATPKAEGETVTQAQNETGATEAEASTAATEGGDTTPAPEGGETTPAAEGAETTPAAEGAETTLAAEGGETTLALEGGETTPAVEGGETTPAAEGATEAATEAAAEVAT